MMAEAPVFTIDVAEDVEVAIDGRSSENMRVRDKSVHEFVCVELGFPLCLEGICEVSQCRLAGALMI